MANRDFDTNEEVQETLEAIMICAGMSMDLAEAIAVAEHLEKDARIYIADALEQTLIRELSESSAEDIKGCRELATALENARKNDPAQLPALEEQDADIKGTSQLFAFVFNNKGEQASRLVKFYAQEAAKLSDAEYALSENHMKVLCNATELAQGTTPDLPKTNPFRKKNAPGL